ncbi:MAG: alanine--tRNA ligase [Bacteroidales bacterium]|nr:alanine--tRNA ligase [Bacteroidales bacterium]
MNSSLIRKNFLNFFKSKNHTIIPSSPIVVKGDPTLMFTNAGMNQFKNIFLGNNPAKLTRITNTQKCLRVSGKHNDLEEVGRDTYHHTMFEMLGNWSFGDYFKKEAVEWAWELLTEIYKIDKKNLYVTVFEGSEKDNLPRDDESYNYWKNIVDEDKIIWGNKKDNFWEMGDVGPCGPCSEIHIDLRDENEKKLIPGKNLVNKGNPLVIEIWNLVFIQYNKLANGSLIPLPQKHVDTGMGLERLCMVLQNKKSNYDTDIFQPLIHKIEDISNIKYSENTETDIAIRVIADHIRAISFAIADGQLPSNTGAGYVIRRILRRAVRYGFTFLNLKEPFLYNLVQVLVDQMGEIFPEIVKQYDIINKVIYEEEVAFLRTLSIGINKFEKYISSNKENKIIDGDFAFELYDTYGFPIDLTQLMAEEKSYSLDMENFNKNLQEQKNRSRKASNIDTEDWVTVNEYSDDTEFIGYDFLEADVNILKYRKVKAKKKEYFEIVLDKTPFYAESGGQVGDRGYFISGDEKISVENTIKENNQIIHITKKLPKNIDKPVKAVVDKNKRTLTANNHSATHLLHAALKQVLGNHVEQKGSLVDENHLRFDFSHYAKLSDEEILKVEKIVNKKIRQNIQLIEKRNVPVAEAKKMGATALFGEKYGEYVRVIIFDKNYSIELCGGTHVNATGQIGMIKITSESAIAAGIRRIEAITADKAEDFFFKQINTLNEIKTRFKNSKNIIKSIDNVLIENNKLQKEINKLNKEKAQGVKKDIIKNIQKINNINFIAEKVPLDTQTVKDLAFDIKNSVDNLFLLLGNENGEKANITIIISNNLIKEKGLNAGNIIKVLAKEINGGGGGQPHFATAGGRNSAGITKAFEKAREIIEGVD